MEAIRDGGVVATTTAEVIQEFAQLRARRRGRPDAAAAGQTLRRPPGSSAPSGPGGAHARPQDLRGTNGPRVVRFRPGRGGDPGGSGGSRLDGSSFRSGEWSSVRGPGLPGIRATPGLRQDRRCGRRPRKAASRSPVIGSPQTHHRGAGSRGLPRERGRRAGRHLRSPPSQSVNGSSPNRKLAQVPEMDSTLKLSLNSSPSPTVNV